MLDLKENKIPFKLTKTLYTMNIECEFGKFSGISPHSNIPQKELFFIQMVKRGVSKFDLRDVPEININEIKYFDLPKNNFEYEDCFEVDISGAYWNLSKPFMDEKVFERGFQVDKITRLAALGNLAKTTTVLNWDGESFNKIRTHTEHTKNLFFHCAKETGEIMDSLRMICNSSVFFWVDALFVREESDLKYIFAFLKLHGLEGKTFKCEKIISDAEKITVYSSEHKKKQRVFFKEKLTSNFYLNRFKETLKNGNGKKKKNF